MVDANKIIEDIIKGAQSTEGFVRGSTMGVERQTLGEETKLAGQSTPLRNVYEAGAQAACDQYKVAFIPALMAGIAGAGKLIKGGVGLGKKLLGSKVGRGVGTAAMMMPPGVIGGGGGGGRVAPGGGGGGAPPARF